MAEEIGLAVDNGCISNFEGIVTLTLDRSYYIPSCITHRNLPMCQVSLKSKKLCGRTDVGLRTLRTDGRTDGRLRMALLGRLGREEST